RRKGQRGLRPEYLATRGHARGDPRIRGGDQGPPDHPRRGRLPLHQRDVASGAGPLRLHPAGAWFPGVPAPVREPQKLDVVIFRENTEDVYSGIEYRAGTEEAEKLRTFIN